MTKFIARVLIAICLVVIGYFLLSLVSVISQVASLADSALPGSAVWVFWGLLFIFSGLLATPLYCFFRLPKPPIPPADDDPDAKKDDFLNNLREHLKRNPSLSDMELASNDEIKPALSKLAQEADAVIKSTASSVFLSTAVMQNGRLDALLVLACQLRMIWRIARIYHGRPSPRHMCYLYGNVGTNVLIADNIQDIDFAAITAPIVVSIFPSIQGSFPGLRGISTLLINSLANGTANAFLTLRVGLIAKAYCGELTAPKEASVRAFSTSESLKLVMGIVQAQGSLVAKRSWEMARDSVKDATLGVKDGVEDAIEKLAQQLEGVKGSVEKIADLTTDTAKTVSKTLGDGIDASGTLMQNVKAAATEGVKDAVETARETLKDVVVQGVKGSFEKLADATTGTAKTFFETARGMLSKDKPA